MSCFIHNRCEWNRVNGEGICVSKTTQDKVVALKFEHLVNTLTSPKTPCPPEADTLETEGASVRLESPDEILSLLRQELPSVFTDFIEGSPVLTKKGEESFKNSLTQLCPLLKAYPEISVHLTGVTAGDKKNRREILKRSHALRTASEKDLAIVASLEAEKGSLSGIEKKMENLKDPNEVEHYSVMIKGLRSRIQGLEREMEASSSRDDDYARVLQWAQEFGYPLSNPPTIGDQHYLLSMKRAQTVFKRLLECGVPENQLSYSGSKKGKLQRGKTASQNRRVDLTYRMGRAN